MWLCVMCQDFVERVERPAWNKKVAADYLCPGCNSAWQVECNWVEGTWEGNAPTVDRVQLLFEDEPDAPKWVQMEQAPLGISISLLTRACRKIAMSHGVPVFMWTNQKKVVARLKVQ